MRHLPGGKSILFFDNRSRTGLFVTRKVILGLQVFKLCPQVPQVSIALVLLLNVQVRPGQRSDTCPDRPDATNPLERLAALRAILAPVKPRLACVKRILQGRS